MSLIQPDRSSFTLWDEHGPKIVGLLVFVLALAVQPENPVPGSGMRDGLYLSIGVALARGWGTVFAHLPDASSVGWLGTGYPHVLSVLIRMWPEMPQGLTLIQLFNSLGLAGGAWGLCGLARQLAFPYRWLDLGVGLMFAAPVVLSLPGSAVPEPMFMMLAVAALAAAVSSKADWRFSILAGALAGLAAVTHGLGYAVVVGVMAHSLGKDKRALSGAVLGALVFVGPWLWRTVTGDPSALALASVRIGLEGQASAGWMALVDVLWGWKGGWALVSGTITFLFLARGVVALWSGARGTAVAIALIAVLVGVFPSAPLAWAAAGAPFVLLAAGVGARRLWGMDRRLRIPVGIVVVLWVGVQIPRAVGGVVGTQNVAAAETIENKHRALTSIRSELESNAVIASDADAAVFLYTNHRTIPLTVLAEAEPVLTLCALGVTHVAIINQNSLPARFVAARNDSNLVREFDLTTGPSLYRISCD